MLELVVGILVNAAVIRYSLGFLNNNVKGNWPTSLVAAGIAGVVGTVILPYVLKPVALLSTAGFVAMSVVFGLAIRATIMRFVVRDDRNMEPTWGQSFGLAVTTGVAFAILNFIIA